MTRTVERRFSINGDGRGSRALVEPRKGEDDEAYYGSEVWALR